MRTALRFFRYAGLMAPFPLNNSPTNFQRLTRDSTRNYLSFCVGLAFRASGLADRSEASRPPGRCNVDSEDQAVLRSQTVWLIANLGVRIRVEGHCDERGAREYNLALGERRANAAKNYLSTLGVSLSRITVVSYGKERPDALGADETAWALNRRAVTVTVR